MADLFLMKLLVSPRFQDRYIFAATKAPNKAIKPQILQLFLPELELARLCLPEMMQQSATDSSGSILDATQVKHLQPPQLSQCFSSQVLLNLHSSFQSAEACLTLKEAALPSSPLHPLYYYFITPTSSLSPKSIRMGAYTDVISSLVFTVTSHVSSLHCI